MTITKVSLTVLQDTLTLLQRKVLQGKPLPIWLPNGEEIKTVSEMASVLNTDNKTASYFILNSEKSSNFLREQAELEIKAVRHVRTQEGVDKYGLPIGALITLDAIKKAKENAKQVLNGTNKPKVTSSKTPSVKKPKAENIKPKIGTSSVLESRSRRDENVLRLVNEQNDRTGNIGVVKLDRRIIGINWEPLEFKPDKFVEAPKSKKLARLNSINSDTSMEDTNKAKKIFDALDFYSHDSEDSAILKEISQFNISQRILDSLPANGELRDGDETKPDSQKWKLKDWLNIRTTDLNALGMLKYSLSDTPEDKFALLKNLGILDGDADFDIEMSSKGKYNKYLNHINDWKKPHTDDWNKSKDLPDYFKSSLDREKFVRLGLVYSIIKTDVNQIKPEEIDMTNYMEHSTESLLILAHSREVIKTWATTSGDTHPEAIQLQLEIKEAFDIKDSPVKHLKTAIVKNAKHEPIFKQSFIQATYQETQDFFKANGIKSLAIYRGTHHKNIDDIPDDITTRGDVKKAIERRQELIGERYDEYVTNFIYDNRDENWLDDMKNEFKNHSTKFSDSTLEEMYETRLRDQANYDWNMSESEYYDDKFKEYLDGTEIWDTNVSMQPASSWSLDTEIAEQFARMDSGVGIVFNAVVPVERILSTPFSGLGCLNEKELILLGGKGRVNAVLGVIE